MAQPQFDPLMKKPQPQPGFWDGQLPGTGTPGVPGPMPPPTKGGPVTATPGGGTFDRLPMGQPGGPVTGTPGAPGMPMPAPTPAAGAFDRLPMQGQPGTPAAPDRQPQGTPVAPDRQPQTVPPLPKSLPDPTTSQDQSGINQFQSWAQQTFGRQATPQELQQIAQQVGYTGGPLTPEMLAKAQDAARTMAQGQGWKPTDPAAPKEPSLKDSIQQRLQDLLNQDPNKIDPNSPEFASQRNAFRRGQQRSIEEAKRNAAQRNAQGLTGGANESAMTGIDLAAAQGEGDFEAQIYTQELTARRQQLQQALSQAIQYGLGDQAQQIQKELGQNDLELRKYLGRGQLGLGLLQTMLGNEQSRNALGFNYAALQGQMDQQLLNALLGGLR